MPSVQQDIPTLTGLPCLELGVALFRTLAAAGVCQPAPQVSSLCLTATNFPALLPRPNTVVNAADIPGKGCSPKSICCLTPGSHKNSSYGNDGCEGIPRCGTNPTNKTACVAPPPPPPPPAFTDYTAIATAAWHNTFQNNTQYHTGCVPTWFKSDDDSVNARKVFVSMFAESALDAEGMHAFANVMINENLTALLQAHKKFGVPGFLDIQKAGVWAMPAVSSQNQNETGLTPGWRAALDKQLDAAMPHFATQALVGVFLGDETMCDGVSVANFTAVSDAVKARVGTSGLVASNECTDTFTTANTKDQYAGSVVGKLPASLDIVSVDTYAAANRPAHCSTVPAPPSWGSCSYRIDRDFNPETKGAPAGRCCCPASQPWCRSNEPATEANSTRAFYERFLMPHLLPHQKLFLIPGLFGVKWNCSDPAYVSRLFTLLRAHALSSQLQLLFTHCTALLQDCAKRFNESGQQQRWPYTANPALLVSPSVQEQEVGLVAKLDGYAQWMREDAQVMGLMNWHWDTYHFCCPKAPSADLYSWGVASMPSVQARLVEVSKEFGLKTTDDEAHIVYVSSPSEPSHLLHWRPKKSAATPTLPLEGGRCCGREHCPPKKWRRPIRWAP